MRTYSRPLALAVCIFLLGCNGAEEARQKSAQQNLERIAVALQNYRQAARREGGDPPAGIGADLHAVVEGSNRFAVDLYRRLSAEEGNLFFSPSSISTALAMASGGAAGDTKAEMIGTLHLDLPDQRLHPGMEALQAFWSVSDADGGIRLNLANRMWGQADYEFLPSFLELTREHYGAEMAQVDFADSEGARNEINDWVADQTEGKIQDLMGPGSISSNSRLVLANAVYFHGDWAEPFKKSRTEEEEFFLTTADAVRVPLMNRQDALDYSETEDLQILRLPYGDGSLSMVVLLPREKDGLSDLEEQLSFENLEAWLSGMEREDTVVVYLPRFKTTSRFGLAGTLHSMGMPSAFDPNTADFSGIARGEGLFLSAVIHQAYVDVNEEGTEAAAATGVAVATAAAPVVEPKQPPVFRADHPFLFLIRDDRTGAILFLGRIVDPREAE